jgi:hypothetical protein
MKPEAKVKAMVARILEARPRAVRFPVCMNSMMKLGTPDVLACLDGWFVAIECKADDAGRLSAAQAGRLDEILAAGGFPLVVHAGNVGRLGELAGLAPVDFGLSMRALRAALGARRAALGEDPGLGDLTRLYAGWPDHAGLGRGAARAGQV